MVHAKVNVVDAGGGVEVLFGRAVVEKIVAAADDPRAEAALFPGVAPAADVVVAGAEIVFAIVRPGAHALRDFHDLLDPGFLRGAVVRASGHRPVAEFVHADPVEKIVGDFPHHAPLTDAGGRVARGVVEHGVGIDAGVAAAQREMHLDVERLRLVFPHAFAGDIDQLGRLRFHGKNAASRAAVVRPAVHAEIDIPAAGLHHFGAAEFQRGDVSAGLVHGRGDDPVVEDGDVAAVFQLHGLRAGRGGENERGNRESKKTKHGGFSEMREAGHGWHILSAVRGSASPKSGCGPGCFR